MVFIVARSCLISDVEVGACHEVRDYRCAARAPKRRRRRPGAARRRTGSAVPAEDLRGVPPAVRTAAGDDLIPPRAE